MLENHVGWRRFAKRINADDFAVQTDVFPPIVRHAGFDGLANAAEAAVRPALPTGPLSADGVAQALGALLPEGAIVSDEANTSGLSIPLYTASAPRHDWLTLTGGAIGQGLAVATGAAVACPDRQVICLEADGSALYTIQALWTQAREGLDVILAAKQAAGWN